MHLFIPVSPFPSPILPFLCIRGVPNSGFRLFGRIRIFLRTIRPNKNTNSVAGWAFWCCTCCSDIYHLLMSLTNYGHACVLSSRDPLPFIRLIVSKNQAVWVRAAGTDWVKSAVDVTSCTIHVQTNYSYSFWWHYSSEYEYTIRQQSEYEANIRYIPTMHTCSSCHNCWHALLRVHSTPNVDPNLQSGRFWAI